MAKPLSFKDFIVVDYKPGEDELIKYAAHKRHRGRIGEETEETTDEALTFSQRRARGRAMKKNKAKIAMGRRRAAKKPADNARLQKRAQKQARHKHAGTGRHWREWYNSLLRYLQGTAGT